MSLRNRLLHQDAAIWGDVDEDTGLMPMCASHGLLFTVDMRSGRMFEPGEDLCYFIGAVGDTHVKIGKSTDVKKRLNALQLSCPVRLKVLAVARGGRAQEAAYHKQFADDRAWGEWFWRSPAIERELGRLTKSMTRKEAAAQPNLEFEIYGLDDVRRLAA